MIGDPVPDRRVNPDEPPVEPDVRSYSTLAALVFFAVLILIVGTGYLYLYVDRLLGGS